MGMMKLASIINGRMFMRRAEKGAPGATEQVDYPSTGLDVELRAVMDVTSAWAHMGDLPVQYPATLVGDVRMVELPLGMGIMVFRDVKAGGVMHVQSLSIPMETSFTMALEANPPEKGRYLDAVRRAATAAFDTNLDMTVHRF